MGLFFVFLSLIDILAGILIYFQGFFIFPTLILYLGYIVLMKGIWSVFSSISSGYYFDWMGIIDLISGFSLILIFYGILILPFQIIAVITIIKGVYSLLLSL